VIATRTRVHINAAVVLRTMMLADEKATSFGARLAEENEMINPALLSSSFLKIHVIGIFVLSQHPWSYKRRGDSRADVPKYIARAWSPKPN
jgi:hypothetical protein